MNSINTLYFLAIVVMFQLESCNVGKLTSWLLWLCSKCSHVTWVNLLLGYCGYVPTEVLLCGSELLVGYLIIVKTAVL